MAGKKYIIANAALYQIGWFCCMLSSDITCGLAVTLLAVWLHMKVSEFPRRELIFIVIACLLGYGMDRAVQSGNWLNLQVTTSNSTYLLLIWILFASTLRSSFAFIMKYLHRAVLLALCAPAAYLIGQKLERVHYTEPVMPAMLIHSLSWSILMIVLYNINKKIFTSYEKL